MAELAKPAVAAPVTLRTDKGSVTIPPAAIAEGLRFTADKAGKLTPQVDVKRLRTALGDDLAAVEVPPKDATMTISGGKPKVADGRPGQQVDSATLGRDLLAVLPKADGREVTGELKPAEPELTAEKLAGLGIKERVSTFTTRFTGGLSSPRSQNIVHGRQGGGRHDRAAREDVLAQRAHRRAWLRPGLPGRAGDPGRQARARRRRRHVAVHHHSLQRHLLRRSGGRRAQAALVLVQPLPGGHRVDHLLAGPGLQVPQQHAARRADRHLVHVEHDHRVDLEHEDLRQRQDASTARAATSPSRRRSTWSPARPASRANGIDGFTQDAFRVIKKDGKVVKREKFTWRYDAEPRYICGPEPS